MINKDRVVKFFIILFIIYCTFKGFNIYYNDSEAFLLQKVLIMTTLITFFNFIFPTL